MGAYRCTNQGLEHIGYCEKLVARWPKHYPFIDVRQSEAGLERYVGLAREYALPMYPTVEETLSKTPWATTEIVEIGFAYLDRDILEYSSFSALYYLLGLGAWPALDGTGPSPHHVLLNVTMYLKDQYDRYRNFATSNPRYRPPAGCRPWNSLTFNDLCHGFVPCLVMLGHRLNDCELKLFSVMADSQPLVFEWSVLGQHMRASGLEKTKQEDQEQQSEMALDVS
ncbi:uncharacterized protein L969DRAFT_68581 [Mixia osmundae IAM 14324]|uniref:Uncharacterized protein n=1 Tax=Mixia osmundae (strain CBS 9802 / IAM 14324 / JCM 22182 / KY 12970) TaxID=764103 RepID=G7E3W3_MIXOS|nr:uncharacterized protein L969DRAFT_68581 [Mixia osmundae IAM 14324]KEI41968.1 hypothetical protein L969DRAFT_68581 [Mixia osmundae IAM 14324]GAA97523.1 hypothetical protein E5Q_04201 [Mixia osmundae IAM 14324]